MRAQGNYNWLLWHAKLCALGEFSWTWDTAGDLDDDDHDDYGDDHDDDDDHDHHHDDDGN